MTRYKITSYLSANGPFTEFHIYDRSTGSLVDQTIINEREFCSDKDAAINRVARWIDLTLKSLGENYEDYQEDLHEAYRVVLRLNRAMTPHAAPAPDQMDELKTQAVVGVFETIARGLGLLNDSPTIPKARVVKDKS